jgi:hypothetical protein
MNIEVFLTVIPHHNNWLVALSVHALKKIEELPL